MDPLAEQTMEPYLYTGNNPIMFTDPTGMSKDDWYKDKNGNFIYDSELTKNNSSYRLSKDEKYVGESVKISVDKYGENPGTINLSKSGEITSEGKRFLNGNISRTESNGLVEVDFNLKDGVKVYGTQDNPAFSGDAKDEFELSTFSGKAKEIKEMDVKIKTISQEITGHHRRVKLNESNRDFDKLLPPYTEDGRKTGDAGDFLNASRQERDSVNKVKMRDKMLEKRNNIKR